MSAIAAIDRPPGKAWHFLQLAPVRIVVAMLVCLGASIGLLVLTQRKNPIVAPVRRRG